jgi:hypothetical protein
MIGCFVLGGLLTFVALKAIKRHRYGCWHHGHHFGRHGRFGGGGHGHFGDAGPYGDEREGRDGHDDGKLPYFLRYLSRRLYATPAQERTVAEAVEQFHSDVAPLRGEAHKTRSDLAAAMRRPSFDEVQMGELFARHDEALEKLRKAVVGLGARVHEALDERQRDQLATMIERGPGFRGGPSRFGWSW